MNLGEYRKKRRFEATPEPAGRGELQAGAQHRPVFVVQKHDARRLHYDFRLEIDGVLASWAVPKGPSVNPADKRLAMQTEDHPMEYAGFEGVIPEGNYGAGPVMVWDRGTYEMEGRGSAAEQLARGELKFRLHGQKLHGSFVLVRTRGRPGDPREGKQWLLIKHRDEHVDASWDMDRYDWSVLTGRSLREIGQGLPAHAGNPAELDGARKAPMPANVEPMLATLIEKPFSDPAWLFELKWDGMRIVARVAGGRCELRSRRGRNVTSQYPELADLPARLSAKEAIVDGEAVVLDEKGRPDFGLMQQRMNVAHPPKALLDEAPVILYVFDILHCDGYDLRGVPLVERKQFLKRILTAEHPVRYSDHITGSGEDLYRLAQEQGLEGIIGKHAQSRYSSGRSPDWVKLKTTREVDAVVGGYTAPRGSREHFGALLLGLYEDSKLRYIGGCGSGFNQKTQEETWRALQEHRTDEPPFSARPVTREQAWWVKPALAARVKFTEWTQDGHLRAPVFLGLRTDAAPEDCRLETERPPEPAPVEPAPVDAQKIEAELRRNKADTLHLEVGGPRLRLTNLGKVYFPDDGYTKRDLLCYYVRVADLILPFLRNRPLVLRRMPDGIQGQLFYQKDAHEQAPEWMPTFPIYAEDVRKTISYFICNDLAGLLFLANLGCIDHDPWSSQIDDLDHPDYAFFDLDPTEGADFAVVVQVAREIHRLLAGIGLRPFLKMSGASGFHIYLPLERVYSYQQARTFTEIVARVVHARLPDETTLERVVEKRPPGRVYLDFTQISYGRPLACVYSVRPVAGACVSAPVAPAELRRGLTPGRFTIKTMPARLRKAGDLWADFWKSRQRLEPALERLRTEVRR